MCSRPLRSEQKDSTSPRDEEEGLIFFAVRNCIQYNTILHTQYSSKLTKQLKLKKEKNFFNIMYKVIKKKKKAISGEE